MEVKVQGSAWLPGKAAQRGGQLIAEDEAAEGSMIFLTFVFRSYWEGLLITESIFRIYHEIALCPPVVIDHRRLTCLSALISLVVS